MNTINKEGVIYTRVSSIKQVTEGSGLDGQYTACCDYAKEKNIKIVKVFKDAALSGNEFDRPGLHQMIDFIKKRGKEIFVIFDDISRFSRNIEDYYFFKAKIRRYGGTFLSVKEDLESQKPINRLLEGMAVTVGDYHRWHNLEILNSRMRKKLQAGYWLFKAPIGMRLVDKILYPDNTNSVLIKKIYEDYALGRYITYESIKYSKEAQQLINPYNNKPYQLSNDLIKKILTNKLYIGIIDYPKWGFKDINATHEGFIDKELFYKVQQRIKSKKRKKYSVVGVDHFPLKGDIECGSCSAKLLGNYSTGRDKKKYPYYRCDSSRDICDIKPKNMRRDVIHDEFIELLKKARINKDVLKLADKIMEDTFNKNSNHQSSIRNHNQIKIDELSKRKKAQLDKIIEASNPSVIKVLEKEIESIDRQIKALDQVQFSEDDVIRFKLQGKTLLSHPDKAWQQADSNTKKIIFNFIFEENLKVIDGKIGNTKYSLPYRVLKGKTSSSRGLVELRGIEPRTS